MTVRRRPNRKQHSADKDSGAALILAIGFVVMIGAISGGLAALATSSLNNRATLEIVRDREFAADGVIEQAITQVRLLNCSSPNSSVIATLNQVPIRVDWVNACDPTSVHSSDGVSYPQRNVIFTACVNPGGGAACAAANVIIRAQVNFEPAVGTVTKTYIQSWNVNR